MNNSFAPTTTNMLNAQEQYSRLIRNQLEQHQKQTQMSLLASTVMQHMTSKVSCLAATSFASCFQSPVFTTSYYSPTLHSPPASPSLAVPTNQLMTRVIKLSQAQPLEIEPRGHAARYAPYQRTTAVPTINCVNPRSHKKSTATQGASPPLTPTSHKGEARVQRLFSASPSPQPLPLFIKTTAAESLQIQKIVMTTLSTLRLPSHTIVLALYFVHKLLSITLSRTNSHPGATATAALPIQQHQQSPLLKNLQDFPSITPANVHSHFSTNAVGLFLAGLMFADTVLCDAPVSVGTWSWILQQSCPPFSPMCERVKQHPTFARDVRKWGLDLLQFDVNVDSIVYQGWLNSVKAFLEQQEREKRRTAAAAAAAAAAATAATMSNSFYIPGSILYDAFSIPPVLTSGGGAGGGGGSTMFGLF